MNKESDNLEARQMPNDGRRASSSPTMPAITAGRLRYLSRLCWSPDAKAVGLCRRAERLHLPGEAQVGQGQRAVQNGELPAWRDDCEAQQDELVAQAGQLRDASADTKQMHADAAVDVQERAVEIEMSTEELRLEVRARKTAEEEAHRQASYLSAQRAIDSAITGSLDLQLTSNVIIDQVTSHLGVSAATLLLDNKTNALQCVASRGFRSSTFGRSPLRLGDGHAGRAALEATTIVVPDLTVDGTQYTGVSVPAEEGFAAYLATPLIAKGRVKGVLEVFHRAKLECTRPWLDMLEAFAKQAAMAVDSLQLFESLRRSNLELSAAYDATIEGWSRALDMRDKETEGHSQRVTDLTMQLGAILGVSEDDLVHMRRGALLHDIGKIGVPDSILLKPAALTPKQWDIMRGHPALAYDLLSPVAYLRRALDIPCNHHEKWDGTGYPNGLKHEGIPLAARIFAVADVSDALRSDRPYRAAWPRDEVLEHIAAQSGIHFDPRVVDAFLRIGDHHLRIARTRVGRNGQGAGLACASIPH